MLRHPIFKDFRETICFSQPASAAAQIAFKRLIQMLRRKQPEQFYFTVPRGIYVVVIGKGQDQRFIELDIRKHFIVINYRAAITNEHRDFLEQLSASFPERQDFVAGKAYRLSDQRVIVWADDICLIDSNCMQQAMYISLMLRNSIQNEFLAYHPYKIFDLDMPIMFKRPLYIRRFEPAEVEKNADIYAFLMQTQAHNPIFPAGMLLPFKPAENVDMQLILFPETMVMRPRSAHKPGQFRFAIKMLPLDYKMLDQDKDYAFGVGGMSTVERFAGKVCYNDVGMLFFQQMNTKRARAGKAIKDCSKKDEKYSAVRLAKKEARMSQQGAPWLKMSNPVHGKGAQGENISYLFLRLFTSCLLNVLVMDGKAKCKKLTVSDRLKIITAILPQISYMHKHDVAHVDGKADNVCFEDPADLTSVKIIDFGLSKSISKMTSKWAGSENYIAPELLEGAPFSPLTDMFSYGTLFIYVLGCTEEYSYSNMYIDKRDNKRKLDVIRPMIENMFFGMRKHQSKDEFYLSKAHRRQLYELVCQGMCNIDPGKRPTWETVNTEFARIQAEHEALQNQYKASVAAPNYKP